MYAANIFGEEDSFIVSPDKIRFTYYECDKFSKDENEVLNAIENILYWFFYRKRTFAVQGGAGTGKTTIIRRLIQLVYNERVYLCAPTHKAVFQFGVLSELLTDAQLEMCKVEIGTLQKGLGLRVDIDDNGDTVYEITGQGELFKNSYDYIIVDEASMVSKEQFYTLMSIGVPILFIGDKNQLPPVSKEYFSVYNFFKEDEIYYITEKRRFKSERFKALIKEIEDAIEKGEIFEDRLLDWAIYYNDVLKGTAKMPDDLAVYYIDYTNKGGVYYWLSRHGHYYILDEVYYAKGETRNVSKTKRYRLKDIIEEYYIFYRGQKIKCKRCLFIDEQDKEYTLWVYNPNEEEIIKLLKRKVRLMLKKHSATLDMFVDLTPICKEELQLSPRDYNIIKNAVMLYPEKIYTVHAAQGSTFENVLVNIGSFKYVKRSDKEMNLEKLRLFYVAVSRAKECVYYKL